MCPEILHLYGPFAINTFGVFVALGIGVFTWLLWRDPRRSKIISSDQLFNLLLYSAAVGWLGARFLYLLTNEGFWGLVYRWYTFWEPGFSLLGGVIALLIFAPLYLYYHRIPILPMLDLGALYAPLLQAIARIGCLCAGCCYGIPTTVPWAIPANYAMHGGSCLLSIHPTQLYSAGLLLLIFIAQYVWLQKIFRRPGELLSVYLILSNLERFSVEFWRAEQEYLFGFPFLTIHQLLALAIIGGAATFLLLSRLSTRMHER